MVRMVQRSGASCGSSSSSQSIGADTGAPGAGRGLYGADLKQVGDRVYLIEVNINPNIDAGHEDQVLGDVLYSEILGVFARRIAETAGGAAQRSAP